MSIPDFSLQTDPSLTLGTLAGMARRADEAAPALTPWPTSDAQPSLEDLTDRVNLLLRAQAYTLSALVELLVREGKP